LAILQLNAEVFPKWSNVYDSLGEAYMQDGDLDQAIRNYAKSLELNPQNSNAIERLNKLQEKRKESAGRPRG
jgi:cytochrome c-type biogenesis protein CcmH/NrfG